MGNIIQLMRSCEDLLRGVGEIFWAKKMDDFLRRAENDMDARMLDEILSWYGGMGSLGDLVISRCNDHFVNESNEKSINDELRLLIGQIYQEAVRFKSD